MDDKMPLLGFGAMRLPTLGADDKIDLPRVCEMIDAFLEKGFLYIDTAYVYHSGQSEKAMQNALVKRHPRESFRLATKMPIWITHAPADLDRIFTEQLRNCGVDYFDYYLLHSLDRSKEKNLRQTNSFDFIQRLKKEGKARFVGFSFHDSAETLDEILTEHPEVDFVQLQINYVDVKMGPAGDWYKTARKHNKPIIVMEPVKGGTLAKMDPPVEAILKAARPEASPASWALRYAASLPGVFTVLSGMSNLEQLKDNLNTFEHFEPITPEDEQALEKAVAELAKISQVPCTACKYCLESCPQGIAIPQIFSAYNELRRVTRGEQWNSKMLYDSIPAGHRADDCVSCAACEEHCPQGIHIREELQNAAQALAG